MDLELLTLDEDLEQMRALDAAGLRELITDRGTQLQAKLADKVVRTEDQEDRRTRAGYEVDGIVSKVATYQDIEDLRSNAGLLIVLDHTF